MVGGRASFEIQALRDNHWQTEVVEETEVLARSAAKTILAKPFCQGVRIIKNWRRADGIVTENIIYTELREPEPPRVTIIPIEEAPLCLQTNEYYRSESRSTVNRLLRKYLEREFLTPTELFHNYNALKKVQAADTLFPAAVDRLATVQARAAGTDPRARRDEIYRAIAEVTARARTAERHPKLPKLKGDDVDQVLAGIKRFAPPGEMEFYSLVVLSRHLTDYRSWLGKLDRLVTLTRAGQKFDVVPLVDGMIADLVGLPAALQDMLGYRRNLADALCAMIDLWEGRAAADKGDAVEQTAELAELLARGRLEETRQALFDSVLRQLAGGQPLSRHDPTRERDAFRDVVRRLFRPEGLTGGPRTAEALTRRFVFQQEAGGQAGLRQAVEGVLVTMGVPLFSFVYLLELAASPLGYDLMGEIVVHLDRLVGVEDVDSLLPKSWPVMEKIRRVTQFYDVIANLTVLPDADRFRLLDELDRLLCLCIQREGIIERLDDPKAKLRDRTTRLLEFCAARILPASSKARVLAGERVVALLRQTNFAQRFVEDIDDSRAREEALRGLDALLERGGFK